MVLSGDVCCCNNKRSSKLEDLDAKLHAEVFYFILLHLHQIYPNHHPVLCIMAPFSLAHIFTLLLLAAVSPPSACCLASTQPGPYLRQHLAAASPPQPIPPSPPYRINPLLQTQCFQSAVCKKTGPAHLPPQKDQTALC